MDKIAIFSDVHANLTALEAVLDDIKNRNVSKIICLGDIVMKGCHPDLVIDKIRKSCDIVIKGNCDESVIKPLTNVNYFWTKEKIGKERQEYLNNLPVFTEFYMSGRLIRLFHASPQSLHHIYNPIFSNKGHKYEKLELNSPEKLFENTDFLGNKDSKLIPDIVGYGHIHTPNLFRFGNKMLFNVGSVGLPVQMENSSNSYDSTITFSNQSTYTILEGTLDSKSISSFSINFIRVPYDIEKEINDLKFSDFPIKDKIIKMLQSSSSI